MGLQDLVTEQQQHVIYSASLSLSSGYRYTILNESIIKYLWAFIICILFHTFKNVQRRILFHRKKRVRMPTLDNRSFSYDFNDHFYSNDCHFFFSNLCFSWIPGPQIYTYTHTHNTLENPMSSFKGTSNSTFPKLHSYLLPSLVLVQWNLSQKMVLRKPEARNHTWVLLLSYLYT